MQFCGVFPVSGLLIQPKKVKFSYLTPTTIVNIIFIAFTIFESIIFSYVWVTTKGGFNQGFILIYTLLFCSCTISLHLLARRWPDIIKRWSEKEEIFLDSAYPKPPRKFSTLFTRISLCILVYSVPCYSTYLLWRHGATEYGMETCHTPQNLSTIVIMTVNDRSHIFTFFKFRVWMIPLSIMQYYLSDLAWLFGFNFPVLVSIWLTERLKQFLDRIERETKREYSQDWEEIYDHFNKIVDLVATVDNDIGLLVVTTCMTRMIFICFMIFKAFGYVWDNSFLKINCEIEIYLIKLDLTKDRLDS